MHCPLQRTQALHQTGLGVTGVHVQSNLLLTSCFPARTNSKLCLGC